MVVRRQRVKEVVCESVVWIDLAQDWDRRRGVNCNKPSGSVECKGYPD